MADPFLLKRNGEYYVYATGDPIPGYGSTDVELVAGDDLHLMRR